MSVCRNVGLQQLVQTIVGEHLINPLRLGHQCFTDQNIQINDSVSEKENL